MTTPAAQILITAGIVLFFLIMAYAAYRMPLGLSLSVSRDTNHLAGDIGFRYGVLSFSVCMDTEIYGRIGLFSREIFRFSLQDTLSPDHRETPAGLEEKDDESLHLTELMHWIRLSMRYAHYCIKHLSIDHLTCRMRMGIVDPCTTGMVYGWIWAVISLLPDHADIQVTPCFEGIVLEGSGSLQCLIHTPADLVVTACRLIIPEMVQREFS